MTCFSFRQMGSSQTVSKVDKTGQSNVRPEAEWVKKMSLKKPREGKTVWYKDVSAGYLQRVVVPKKLSFNTVFSRYIQGICIKPV